MNARIVLVVLTFAFAADAPAAESSKYPDAVHEFADIGYSCSLFDCCDNSPSNSLHF